MFKIKIIGTEFQASYLKKRLEAIFSKSFFVSQAALKRGSNSTFDMVIECAGLDEEKFYAICRRINGVAKYDYQKDNAKIDFKVFFAEETPLYPLVKERFDEIRLSSVEDGIGFIEYFSRISTGLIELIGEKKVKFIADNFRNYKEEDDVATETPTVEAKDKEDAEDEEGEDWHGVNQ